MNVLPQASQDAYDTAPCRVQRFTLRSLPFPTMIYSYKNYTTKTC